MGGWNGDRKLRKTWKISIFRKNAISGKSFLGPINEFLNFFFGKRQNTSWSCSQYSKFATFRRKSIKIFDPNYGKIRKMQKILLQKFCKNALNLRPLGDFWGVIIWPVPKHRFIAKFCQNRIKKRKKPVFFRKSLCWKWLC